MIEGLDRGVVGRDDQVSKEIIKEFRGVREVNVEEWMKCGEGKESRYGVRELEMVKQMEINEVTYSKLHISNSLQFKTKIGIPPCNTTSILMNQCVRREG